MILNFSEQQKGFRQLLKLQAQIARRNDANNALILVRGESGSLDLKTVLLP